MVATRTRRKGLVGGYIRRLRERSRKTMDDAAEFLEVQRPTIVRMEKGETLCKRRDLQALIAWYGGSDEEIREALALWEDAKQDTTRITLPGSTPTQLRSFLRAEADASSERIAAPYIVNGLLQTYEYALAVERAPGAFRRSESESLRYVDSRLSRQGRLKGSNPLHVHAVLDECAVRRVVGGVTVMREQLQRLESLATQSNVTLQVIAYSAGAYGIMSGASTILEFPDASDPAAAYLEYPGGGKWAEGADVEKLAATFEVVARAALSPTDTVALFRRQIEELSENE